MKKIKIITIIILIILITMVSFLGVYVQVQNRMENKVKEYDLDMDLKGARYVRLKVNTESTEIIKDADGNEVELEEEMTDEQLTENGYVKESVPNNSEDILTVENYEKTKEIIEDRLKSQRVGEYEISVDTETGDILIQIPENEATDSLVSNMNNVGKFEIIDADTQEVLMDNEDIKLVNVMYGATSSTSNATTVYLNIEFNKQGREKLENISNTYVETVVATDEAEDEEEVIDEEEAVTEDEEEIIDEEEAVTEDEEEIIDDEEVVTEEEEEIIDEEEAVTEEEEVIDDEEVATEDEATETITKEVTLKIDDEEIMTTTFDEPIENGTLQLSMGSATTDVETLQDNITQASSMATMLDSGNLPIKYDIESNEYIASDITSTQIQYIVLAIGIVILVGFIIYIIRYKLNGLIAVITFIGFISLYLLLIRYTNVSISIQGIVGIVVIIMLNYIYINKLLSKIKNSDDSKALENVREKIEENYKEFFIRLIPICISVIAFCFVSWTTISSFGMVMFWGIVLIGLYNYLITATMLKMKAQK